MPRLDLPQQYRKQLEALFERLAPELTVWAFGSRVNGSSHDGSDLDLVLRNPDDLSRRIENLSRIRAAVSEGDFPILIDILDWAVLPESFRAEIEKSHVVLCRKTFDSLSPVHRFSR